MCFIAVKDLDHITVDVGEVNDVLGVLELCMEDFGLVRIHVESYGSEFREKRYDHIFELRK